MINVINVNVDDIDTKFVEDLKNEYAHATVEIIIQNQETPDRFSELDFWDIVNKLNWEANDDKSIIAPVIEDLTGRQLSDIYRFVDILSEKLWQLDTRSHAAVFLVSEDYLSADDFLYARCAVVANGQQYYEYVLHTPSAMPTEVTFEPLLSVAARAYEQKTGKRFTAVSAYNYETYSNKAGWAKDMN